MSAIQDVIRRALAPVRARIMSIVGKAILSAVDDTTGLQTVKVTMLEGEVRQGVERLQDFGFSSNPPADSEAVYLAMGGAKDNSVIVKIDNATLRIKRLKTGEVALYSQWNGQSNEHCIILSEGKIIKIVGAQINMKGNASVDGPLSISGDLSVDGKAAITGNLTVKGDITADGTVKGKTDVVVGALSLSTHVHAVTTAPGTTGPGTAPPAP